MKNKEMKSIGIKMNVLMGLSLSFLLSLTGLLASNHFSLPAWCLNFALSSFLSISIGFIISIPEVEAGFCRLFGLEPERMVSHFLGSFISNLIYTPVITFLLTRLAWFKAQSQLREAAEAGAFSGTVPEIPFIPIFIHSLIFTMAAGYVFILILKPLFFRLLIKKSAPSQQESALQEP